MGNKQSSVIKQTIDVVNQNMVNNFSKTANSATGQITNNQNFELDVAGILDCRPGNLELDQKNQTILNLSAVFKNANSSQIEQQINSAIEAAAQSENKAVSGFLNTKIADSQSTETTVEQRLRNIVTTNIENIVNNACIGTVSNNQNGVIKIPVTGSIYSNGCHFGQDVQANLVVNCITNNVADTIAQDAVLSSNITAAAAAQESTATGPVQEIGSIISSIFTSWWGILLLVFIVIIVVGFIILRQAKKAEQGVIKGTKGIVSGKSETLAGEYLPYAEEFEQKAASAVRNKASSLSNLYSQVEQYPTYESLLSQ